MMLKTGLFRQHQKQILSQSYRNEFNTLYSLFFSALRDREETYQAVFHGASRFKTFLLYLPT